ncbi:hypothetical protein HRG_012208 [Hirsutella rhossiliensis]
MPRAASPSAASRHRLLLPPRGIAFFCRLYWLASTSAASRPRPLLPPRGPDFFCRLAARLLLPPRGPTSSRPSRHTSRCLAPSAAFTGWPRLLPPCGPDSICRPAATTSSGLVGRGAPRSYKSLELKASPGDVPDGNQYYYYYYYYRCWA